MKWRDCGIIGLGTYIPRYRLGSEMASRIWGRTDVSCSTKSVAALDEDALTLAVEAGKRAVLAAGIDPVTLNAVWIGSESKPYAVKAMASTVAACLGTSNNISAMDIEFACRGGIEGMLNLARGIESGDFECGLVVGSDVAQSGPADELEYTASSAAAAFVLGTARNAPYVISESVSHVTDTLDLHRRDAASYPAHTHRFSGEPSYFAHITAAVSQFFERTDTQPQDYTFAVFHQPNAKFPRRIAEALGFGRGQFEPILFADQIGNPYAANTMLGLALALSLSSPGDRLLVASYGSGAGSDCFAVEVRDSCDLFLQIFDDPRSNGVPIRDYGEYLVQGRQVLRGESY